MGRYPAASEAEPNPFFTLHEGEQLRVDFRFALKTLHRVTGTMEEDQNAYSVEDADRANTYLVTRSPFERKFEAWLPNGTFWLSTGGDEDVSATPIQVADSDPGGLQFSIIDPGRIEIPIEITTAPGDPAGPELEPSAGLWYVTMVHILRGDMSMWSANRRSRKKWRVRRRGAWNQFRWFPATMRSRLRPGEIFMPSPLSAGRRTLRRSR
jgi:hypothetical protein